MIGMPTVQNSLKPLYKQLGYTFKTETHLIHALTHRSANSVNNERLEFLGDSILSVVIAEALYNQFPHQSEGQLSRLRAYLVKGETLATIAATLSLGDYLYLGQGELKSGGFRRASILANALEAVFAAIFLDSGFDAAKKVILNVYRYYLKETDLNKNLKDYKTQLQEYLQANKYALPHYHLEKIEGEEHEQQFYVQCHLPQLALSAEGSGLTRRKAEQNAAKILLAKIQASTK